MTAAVSRVWSPAELHRMQGVVESGEVKLAEVGRRFRCSRHTVVALIARHGWRNPHAERTAKRLPKPGRYWAQNTVMHGPEDLCGGRRLTGAEFAARAAELEAIDREERARAQA